MLYGSVSFDKYSMFYIYHYSIKQNSFTTIKILCALHIPSCLSNDKWSRASFYTLIDHLNVFFGKLYIQIFGLFLNWVVCFLYSSFLSFFLNILNTTPLLNICFANIFFQSMTGLHIFLIVSFVEQKHLILIKSNLSLFPPWIMVCNEYLKTHYQNWGDMDFLPFSS